MESKTSDIIAAEIKIGIATNSWSELQELIGKIRKDCKKYDYELNVNIEGNFFQQTEKELQSDDANDFFKSFITAACRAYTTPLTEHGKGILD